MGAKEAAGITALEFDELPHPLRDALRPRYDRLGYLGAFFRYSAHQPAATLAFHEFTEALKAALPAELSEVVALTVASRLRNRYEQVQHEQLALRSGLSLEVIAALVSPEDAPAVLDPRQLAVRRLALAGLADAGHGANGALAEVVALLGEQLAVAALLLVARFVAHALVANTLELAPPVPSVFADPERTDRAAP